MTYSSHLLWVQPSWLEQASQWIDQILDQKGIKRVGAIAQLRIRAWSTVLQIPTHLGNLYFKAVILDLAYEATLTQRMFENRDEVENYAKRRSMMRIMAK